MHFVRLSETLIEWRADGEETPLTRVERGPLLKYKIATQEDFDLASATRRAGPAIGVNAVKQVAPVDKFGRPIVVGQEFAYLDWGDLVWHVYEFCQEDWFGPEPAFRRRGFNPSEVEAAAAASAIAAEREQKNQGAQ